MRIAGNDMIVPGFGRAFWHGSGRGESYKCRNLHTRKRERWIFGLFQGLDWEKNGFGFKFLECKENKWGKRDKRPIIEALSRKGLGHGVYYKNLNSFIQALWMKWKSHTCFHKDKQFSSLAKLWSQWLPTSGSQKIQIFFNIDD